MLVLALVAVIDWMLVVCILSIETASEGEEWYVGEEFAGEDQGQPGITGKPPLALASFYPILLCICFGLQNCIIPLVKELLRHSDTTP